MPIISSPTTVQPGPLPWWEYLKNTVGRADSFLLYVGYPTNSVHEPRQAGKSWSTIASEEGVGSSNCSQSRYYPPAPVEREKTITVVE